MVPILPNCCILIGGMSRRMGQPKHLILTDRGVTWLEQTVALFEPFVKRLVISGRGELPPALCRCERTSDYEGAQGPLAGIIGAMQTYPEADWLVVACDMISISSPAVSWLLREAGKRCDAAGIIPENPKTGKYEPLFAYYRKEACEVLKQMASQGNFRVSPLGEHPQFQCAPIPSELASCWLNVNDPQTLAGLLG